MQPRAMERSASEQTAIEARRRFRAIAERLPISRTLVPTVVEAAMAVARYYAMERAYENHELRTGSAYPPDQREAEEADERAEWRARLARLEPARPL